MRPIWNQFDTARQVVLQAIVENKVTVEAGAGPIESELIVALVNFVDDRGRLETGRARLADWPCRLQFQMDGKRAFHFLVPFPEAARGIVRASVLQRVNV